MRGTNADSHQLKTSVQVFPKERQGCSLTLLGNLHSEYHTNNSSGNHCIGENFSKLKKG